MANTGQKIAGTGANVSRGLVTWSNPTRVNASQGNTLSASCSVNLGGASGSDYLAASSFGFAIPSDATIDGVLFEAGQGVASGTVTCQLQNDSAALFGSSKSYTATASYSVVSVGSSTDLWGATLTPAIINNSNFGARIWTTTAFQHRVDAVWLTVYYTLASGVKAVARSCGVVGT